MTAGFRTQERFARRTADDPVFLMRRDRVEAPGAVFAYDNLSANLLANALEAATGQSVSSFAEQTIFRLLGMIAYAWEMGSNGHSLGHSGLQLRTRDMALLGELALNNGVWSGRPHQHTSCTHRIPCDTVIPCLKSDRRRPMRIGS